MFVNPDALIDQTLENLQLISELLADDLDRLAHPFVSPDIVKVSNTVRTIEVLVPQLKTVREKFRAGCVAQDLLGLPPQQSCINCDD